MSAALQAYPNAVLVWLSVSARFNSMVSWKQMQTHGRTKAQPWHNHGTTTAQSWHNHGTTTAQTHHKFGTRKVVTISPQRSNDLLGYSPNSSSLHAQYPNTSPKGWCLDIDREACPDHSEVPVMLARCHMLFLLPLHAWDLHLHLCLLPAIRRLELACESNKSNKSKSL